MKFKTIRAIVCHNCRQVLGYINDLFITTDWDGGVINPIYCPGCKPKNK